MSVDTGGVKTNDMVREEEDLDLLQDRDKFMPMPMARMPGKAEDLNAFTYVLQLAVDSLLYKES